MKSLIEFLTSALGGKGPALEELPVSELGPRRRQAQLAAVESAGALKRLEERSLAGLDDAGVAKHAAALELARLTSKRDAHNVAAIDAALTVARQREAEAAAIEEARNLCDGRLRNEYDRVATLNQQAYAGKLQLSRMLDRLCTPSVRELIESDPTIGIRPALQALLGDRLPPVAQELFRSGTPLPLKPGPRKGDRRFQLTIGEPRRRETFDGENWVPDRHQTVTRGDA